MIEKRTVLVLGAGASKSYGFPTGEELLHQIVDINQHSPTKLGDLLRECDDRIGRLQHPCFCFVGRRHVQQFR